MRSKTRNFRPFAIANGKENIRLSQSKNHIQTVIFSRETRWTNLPRISFSKPRKARIQMERKLFFAGKRMQAKFWVLGRFVGWRILWFWGFLSFQKAV